MEEDRNSLDPKPRKSRANAIFWWCLAAVCLGLCIWYVFWEGPRNDPKEAGPAFDQAEQVLDTVVADPQTVAPN